MTVRVERPGLTMPSCAAVIDPSLYSDEAFVVIEVPAGATAESCVRLKEEAAAAFGMRVFVLGGGARLARVEDHGPAA